TSRVRVPPYPECRFGDFVRARLVLQAVHLARFQDVPVLAELARQVAARGAEGQDAGPRIKVVERLLLDRVDAEPGGAAVRGEHHAAAFHLAHEAHAALALVQPAVARAQVALDAAVFEAMPPSARVTGLRIHACSVCAFHLITR